LAEEEELDMEKVLGGRVRREAVTESPAEPPTETPAEDVAAERH